MLKVSLAINTPRNPPRRKTTQLHWQAVKDLVSHSIAIEAEPGHVAPLAILTFNATTSDIATQSDPQSPTIILVVIPCTMDIGSPPPIRKPAQEDVTIKPDTPIEDGQVLGVEIPINLPPLQVAVGSIESPGIGEVSIKLVTPCVPETQPLPERPSFDLNIRSCSLPTCSTVWY